MKRSAGITLIELLVSVFVVATLTAGLTRAFVFAASYTDHAAAARSADAKIRNLEDRLTALLRSATLSSDATDTSSYFLAGTQDQIGAAAAQVDSLTFTVSGDRIPGTVLESTDDFEQLNQTAGPQGGLKEVSLSLTPVGDAPTSQGLYLREQRPADGDPTQGGYETLLDPDVVEFSYQFFDGQNWVDTWDTLSGERRLPAAVEVTYRLRDEDATRTLLVRLPLSDATADNPVVTGRSPAP